MPQVNPDASDIEKLQIAFREITSSFGSIESIMESFGLSELPMAQRYGILFGFITFVFTISSVLALLLFGGTFKRIAEQDRTGKPSVESDYRVRLERPLLLERLLSAQSRMMKLNYSNRFDRKEGTTNLTKMLSGVAPPKSEIGEKVENFDFSQQNAESMVGYKQNYFMGYRKCQDKPGGKQISYEIFSQVTDFLSSTGPQDNYSNTRYLPDIAIHCTNEMLTKRNIFKN